MVFSGIKKVRGISRTFSQILLVFTVKTGMEGENEYGPYPKLPEERKKSGAQKSAQKYERKVEQSEPRAKDIDFN